MIDLYFAPTPNGWKISIMLEECGLPYTLHSVRLDRGEQFEPDFLAISPNNRIPAIVDHDPPGGGGPFSIFESGAILLHLADKAGRFLSPDPRRRSVAVQWLFWQVGGLGPMLGQHGHFRLYAQDKIPYAIERYASETRRLYRVLDGQLGRTGTFIADTYSIADMACFPWIMTHKAQGLTLEDYPNIKHWFAEIRARPQVQAGLNVGGGIRPLTSHDEEARRHLFGKDGQHQEAARESK
jgi:GST-like protein